MEAAKSKNAFKYGLNCMYKLLEGRYNLSMQLNVERGELRRKPMRFKNIREPFKSPSMEFHKLPENEVLTPTAIRLATDIMLLTADHSFNILFNSLLGQASINHLHLHFLYWPFESDLINRRFELLNDSSSKVYTIEPPDWLCHAFAFQLTSLDEYDSFQRNLTRCVEFLSDRNQAHNVFITRAQPIRTVGPLQEEDSAEKRPQLVTAYVFPRTNVVGSKPPTNFNPAANELAGCLTCYTVRFFESASEQSAIRIIEEDAQIPAELFERLASDFSDLLSNRPPGTSRCQHNSLPEGLTSPEIDELRDSFQTFTYQNVNSKDTPIRRYSGYTSGRRSSK